MQFRTGSATPFFTCCPGGLIAENPCGAREAALVVVPHGGVAPRRPFAVSVALMNSFGTLNVENIPGSA